MPNIFEENILLDHADRSSYEESQEEINASNSESRSSSDSGDLEFILSSEDVDESSDETIHFVPSSDHEEDEVILRTAPLQMHSIPLQIMSHCCNPDILRNSGHTLPFDIRKSLIFTINTLKLSTPIVYLHGILFQHIYPKQYKSIPFNVCPMNICGKRRTVKLKLFVLGQKNKIRLNYLV